MARNNAYILRKGRGKVRKRGTEVDKARKRQKRGRANTIEESGGKER